MSEAADHQGTVDQLIREFTRELRGNTQPEILEYLSRATPTDQPRLLAELVRAEYANDWATATDVLPTVEWFEARLPDHKEAVRNALLTATSDELQYVLVRELGRGNFGTVYLGHDTVLDRPVAIKVLHERGGDRDALDARRRGRFLNELRIVANFSHPNIVPLYGKGVLANGQLFAVMRYVDGETLAGRIAREHLSVGEVVRIVIAIADGLSYAQRRSLLAHRDLKPENILLDKENTPHIADFGLALSIGEGVVERTRGGGTRMYMAPEQIRHGRDGSPELLEGCDIWAIGVMLYEMLAGKRPFEGDEDQLFEAIEFYRPIPIRRWRQDDAVDEQLENICNRCLEKSAADRYGTARDLRDALQRWVNTHEAKPVLEDELRGFDDLLSRHGELASRPSLSQAVAKYAGRHSRGVLLLSGPMGTGKTDFLIQLFHELVHRGGPRPACFFYRRGTTDPDRCIRHIYASLAISHGLVTPDNIHLPLDPDLAARRLEVLLRQVGVGLSSAAPQFILIDGLDEAQRDSLGKTAYDRLEYELPDHVYVVATTRPVASVSELSLEVQRNTIDLTDPDLLPEYRREVREFIVSSCPVAQAGGDAVVDALTAHADANFLVAKLLTTEWQNSGADSQAVAEAAEHIAHAQTADQLGFLYQRYMRRIARLDDSEHGRHVLAVMRTLAFVEADVPPSLIMVASGIDFPAWIRVKETLSEWLRVLPADISGGYEDRIRVFHATFQSFLEQYFAAEATKAHTAIAAACAAWRESGPLVREYAFRFLLTHLTLAGRHDAIVETSQDFEYLEAVAQAGLLGDLKRALDRVVELLRSVGSPEARYVREIADALWAHLPFINRHPSTMFQCLWNTLWWHDRPFLAAAGAADPTTTGHAPKAGVSRLSEFMERWRAFKERRTPGFLWLRALSPPSVPNGAFSKFEGHANSVTALDVSADGNYVASASLDTSLRLWDFHTGLGVATPAMLPERIDTIRFWEHDGIIIGGGSTGTVYAWDSRTLKLRWQFRAHAVGVCAIAISPDGRRLVTGGRDGSGHLWDLRSRKAVATFQTGSTEPVHAVAFMPDGNQILCTQEGTLYEWTADSVEPTILIASDVPYCSVDTSRQGNQVSFGFVKPTNDPTAPWVQGRVYTRDALERLAHLDRDSDDFDERCYDEAIACLSQFSHDAADCRLSSDGSVVLLSGSDTNEIAYRRITNSGGTIETFTGRIISPTFAVNSHVVFGTFEGTIEAWSLTAQEDKSPWLAQRKDWRAVYGTQLLVLQDAKHAITVGVAESEIEVWDVQKAKCVRKLPLATVDDGDFLDVKSICASKKENRIVVGLGSGGVVIVDLGLDLEEPTIVYPFSTDNIRPERMTVRVNDEVQVTMDPQEASVTATSISGSGGLLLVGNAAGQVAVWDGEPHTKWVRGIHEGCVTAVRLSQDERLIATAGEDGGIHVIDASTGEVIETFDATPVVGSGERADRIISIAFSSDGKRLACGSQQGWFRWLDREEGCWTSVDRRPGRSDFERVTEDQPSGFHVSQCMGDIVVASWATGKECAWLPVNQPFVCKCSSDKAGDIFVVLDDCLRFYAREGDG